MRTIRAMGNNGTEERMTGLMGALVKIERRSMRRETGKSVRFNVLKLQVVPGEQLENLHLRIGMGFCLEFVRIFCRRANFWAREEKG